MEIVLFASMLDLDLMFKYAFEQTITKNRINNRKIIWLLLSVNEIGNERKTIAASQNMPLKIIDQSNNLDIVISIIGHT